MLSHSYTEADYSQQRFSTAPEQRAAKLQIPALNALALRCLASLFDGKQKLFCRSLIFTEQGARREGVSLRHSAIALLGLNRLTESTGEQAFHFAPVLESILANTSWVRSAGDLGLLTWLVAECAPEQLGKLLDEFDFNTAIDSFADGRQGRTKELAWLLTAIAKVRTRAPEAAPELTDVAVDIYHRLQDNQGESGLFGHAVRSPWFTRNHLGTFGDQVHTIYAFTTFARAFHVEEPLGAALSCANAIRSLQGELGQWWFLYDRRTCSVASRYPVLSAHQDGMAPAALLTLGEVTGQSFHEPIYKGLSWIAGANELGRDLRNEALGLIWDSIRPLRQAANWWQALFHAIVPTWGTRASQLDVRYEVRPEHFGWLLYAFGKLGLPAMVSAEV